MSFHVSLVGRKDLSGEVYRQIRRAILDDRLRPGDALPATRELARSLAVSRTSVTVAYERLAAEGFVTSRIGAGTFVSEHIARRGASRRIGTESALQARAIWDSIALPGAFDTPARFDFRTGHLEPSLFPHASWRRLVARSLRKGEDEAGVYQAPAGHSALRAAIARHIAISRGVHATPDDVIVTNGTQQALDIVARALLSPDDAIAVEDPGYAVPRRLFRSLGLRVTGVPVDRSGLVVEALPRRVRAVYVTPSHQYPLGVAMSLERRQALLTWARRTGAAIIEDDYDSEFRFGGRPLEPLQTLDATGRVVYVGSFSKTILPTLRAGFLVAPPSLRLAIHKAKFVTDWHTPSLVQAALAEFIDEGSFARHVRKVSAVYRVRHDLIATTLRRDFADQLELIPSNNGLHLTALARRASADEVMEITRRASEAGVACHPLSVFAAGGPGMAGLVLGYGAIATDDIQEGLHLLRACFDRAVSAGSPSQSEGVRRPRTR